MAGTVVASYSETRTIRKVSLAWTSHTDGTVAGTKTKKLSGLIQRIVFVPGAGAAQPTTLYDVTLEDEQGIDVLAGQGADLSNTAANAVAPGVPLKDGTTVSITAPAIDDQLELKVANAGSQLSGEVHIYVLWNTRDPRG